MRKNYTLILFVLALCMGSYHAKAQFYIQTICGNSTSAYNGDGGPATAAELNTPIGLGIDKAGNLYITDIGVSVIRKINTSGTISTIAGVGSSGYSGDGGQATAAALNFPWGVTTDTAGNVYIADAYNHVVRKVNTSGIISTFAGNGTSGYSGDGGQATAAALNTPTGIAIDASGNVLIADYYAMVVRMVDHTTGNISTIAGTGVAGFSGDGGNATAAELNMPNKVSVDKAGNMYVADTWNQRVRKISSGIITTIAGNGTAGFTGDGGQATAAEVYQPTDVTVGPNGDVYILDHANSAVRMIDGTGTIYTLAGNATHGFCGDGGPATAAEFFAPYNIVSDNVGNLYLTDSYNTRVREMYFVITGTKDVTKNEQVSVYPNPNNGVFNIQLSGASGQSSVEVYNMLGEKIYRQTLRQAQGDNIIDVSNQPNGIYLYRILTETGALVSKGKFVKE